MASEPIVPIYTELLPDGRPLFGLKERDYERIRQGRGCANCLEPFDIPLLRCPTCKTVTDLGRDIVEAPRHWLPSPEEQDVRRAPRTYSPLDDAPDDSALGEVLAWQRKRAAR